MPSTVHSSIACVEYIQQKSAALRILYQNQPTMSLLTTLTQGYFDETVVENEDVFDLAPEEAVLETIDQLYKQQQHGTTTCSSLRDWMELQREQGLSLTHPESKQGKQDRIEQRVFQNLLEKDEWTENDAQQISDLLEQDHGRRRQMMETGSDDVPGPVGVLVGALFWQLADENRQGSAAATSNSLVKLSAFSATSDEGLTAALPIALQVLSAGPSSLRRTRQEKMLHDFVRPSKGWERLFGGSQSSPVHSDDTSRITWLQIIYQVCQGHEPNKKYCNSKPILQTLVNLLQQQHPEEHNSKEESNSRLLQLLTESTLRVLTVLCRFDDFSSQATKGQATDNTGMVVSSAHSTVTMLGTMGIVPLLYSWLLVLKDEDVKNGPLLLALLQCLRSLAIQNEMVTRMVSVGLLDNLQSIFQHYCSSSNNCDDDGGKQQDETLRLSILTALIGLYRNLSANDELKTTLCRSSQQSIVGPLIATLQSLSSIQSSSSKTNIQPTNKIGLTKLQENVCATLGSMALRQPQNAARIVEEFHGHLVILNAMQMSQHSPVVQRQGALAIRNLASRASDTTRQALLDAGAEPILREAAKLGAVDEAYAALRDLGCHAVLLQSNPETGELERRPMFGEKPLQFRPVFD
jgi:hypothetical protein